MSDFHRGTRRFDDVEAASFSPDDTDLTVTEDGGDWVAKDTAGNVVLRYDEAAADWVMGSLNTKKLSPEPDEDISQSISSVISSGKLAAHHPISGLKIVDPADFASNAAALEALNAYLINKDQPTGTLIINPKANSAPQTGMRINRQVEIGDPDNPVSISVYDPTVDIGGFNSPNFERLFVNIDNGDVAFHHRSSAPAEGFSFRLGEVGAAKNNTGLLKLQNQRQYRVEVAKAEDFAGSIFKLDGCDNGFYRGHILPKTTSADIFESVSDSSGIIMERGFRTQAYRHLLNDANGKITAFIDGYHESGDNAAAVSLSNSLSGVHMTGGEVGGGAQVSSVNPVFDLDGVRTFLASAGRISNGSVGVDIDGSIQEVKINPAVAFLGEIDEAINISQSPSSIGVVPNPSLVSKGVTYPTGMEQISSITT